MPTPLRDANGAVQDRLTSVLRGSVGKHRARAPPPTASHRAATAVHAAAAAAEGIASSDDDDDDGGDGGGTAAAQPTTPLPAKPARPSVLSRGAFATPGSGGGGGRRSALAERARRLAAQRDSGAGTPFATLRVLGAPQALRGGGAVARVAPVEAAEAESCGASPTLLFVSEADAHRVPADGGLVVCHVPACVVPVGRHAVLIPGGGFAVAPPLV